MLAALPLLALALLAVWLCWLLGRWLARRALLERVARRNPFMRDLTRTTVRWVVTALGVLVALEIMNATALVGALLGTAGVLGDRARLRLQGHAGELPRRHPDEPAPAVRAARPCRHRRQRGRRGLDDLARDHPDDARRQPPAAAERAGVPQRDAELHAQSEPALRVRRRHRRRRGPRRGAAHRHRRTGEAAWRDAKAAAARLHRRARRLERAGALPRLGRPAHARFPDGSQRGDPHRQARPRGGRDGHARADLSACS